MVSKSSDQFTRTFIIITFIFGYLSSIILGLLGSATGLFITMFMPLLFAVLFNLIEYKSIKSIFKPFTKKVSLRSILFMLLYPLGIIALCAILALVTKQGTLSENWVKPLGNAFMLIPVSIVMFGIGLIEEYGWRGYLLPRLSNKYGLQKANIIVGIIWAMYHFPFLFLINLNNGILQSFGFTLLQLLTIFMFNFGFTYLYTLSQNVILASIMHLLWNNVNVQILGDSYRNSLNSVVLGNIKIINGECLFGLFFTFIFAVYAYRKFNKLKLIQ